jgi:phenylalanine-4-hydroxylase
MNTSDPSLLVELDQDHPGFRDMAYRERRNTIAAIATRYVQGTPVPKAPYTNEEHEVWSQVSSQLAPLHQRHATKEYLEAKASLSLPDSHIPQLIDINSELSGASPFQMSPVAGLITPRVFLSGLAEGVFYSTQYIRHYSKPLYTPEPDVIHECIGHAPTFLIDDLVELNLAFGQAVNRSSSEAAELKLIRAYWYTLEFGVVYEGNEAKALGAGLLSSVDELQRAVSMEHRPFDLDVIAQTPFDPTQVQDDYFAATSWDQLIGETSAWLKAF